MAWISIKGENYGLNSQPGDVWKDEAKADSYKPSVLSDLLGCPFCGSRESDVERCVASVAIGLHTFPFEDSVRCYGCGAITPEKWWNQRAT